MIKIGVRLFNHSSQGYYSATKYVNLQESSGFKLLQAQILAAIDHSWESMSTSEQVSLKQELMGIAHGDGVNWKTLGELKEVLRAKAHSVVRAQDSYIYTSAVTPLTTVESCQGEASSLGNAHVPSSSSALARLLHNAGFASTPVSRALLTQLYYSDHHLSQPPQSPVHFSLRKRNLYFSSRR